MQCEEVRRVLDQSPLDEIAREHLERCATCRREAELSRRVAAAVGGMPRVPAPDGFLDAVMAAVRGQPAVEEPARRAPVLMLRPWELGWIGIACLALLGLLSRLFPGWAALGGAPGPALSASHWGSRLRATAGDGAGFFERSWESGSARLILVMGGDGGPLVWLCGAAAFAVAFFLLLSLARGSAGAMEDAHA